jgi:hypothetical protein
MEERIPIHKIHTIDGIVSPEGQPDGCVTCSEKTMSVCGWRVKRWCLLIALFILLAIGCLIPFVIYAVRFGEATSCRLTYTDSATITEAEMQKWMADEKWPLSVPKYDPWRRTCVCKGFEDKDPMSLLPSDEVLVWIAPGDLVSLSDEEKISPRLPSSFVDKYRGKYSQKDHVKVCVRQELVLALWNIGSDISDGGQHCHVSSGAASSNVEQFYLGWDGALYCKSTTYLLFDSKEFNLFAPLGVVSEAPLYNKQNCNLEKMLSYPKWKKFYEWSSVTDAQHILQFPTAMSPIDVTITSVRKNQWRIWYSYCSGKEKYVYAPYVDQDAEKVGDIVDVVETTDKLEITEKYHIFPCGKNKNYNLKFIILDDKIQATTMGMTLFCYLADEFFKYKT